MISPDTGLSTEAFRRTAPNRELDRRPLSFPEGAFLAIMMILGSVQDGLGTDALRDHREAICTGQAPFGCYRGRAAQHVGFAVCHRKASKSDIKLVIALMHAKSTVYQRSLKLKQNCREICSKPAELSRNTFGFCAIPYSEWGTARG